MSPQSSHKPPVPDEVLARWLSEIADTAEASEQRLKELASRLPGGDNSNYIATLIDFIASEYRWSLDKIAGLSNWQMVAFVGQALKRRAEVGMDVGRVTRKLTEPTGASGGGGRLDEQLPPEG